MTKDFETLMRENGSMIYTLAVRLSGNPADGQDLAQETFVKAFENFERFRGESEFSTWVYRICVNLWKNRVRYEKRRSFWRHFSLDGGAGEEGREVQLAAPDRVEGSAEEASNRKSAVTHALSQLEPSDRAILVLRDMEDRPYDEIAKLLDLPLGTVKSRIARGRERLRQLLEPHMKDIQ